MTKQELEKLTKEVGLEMIHKMNGLTAREILVVLFANVNAILATMLEQTSESDREYWKDKISKSFLMSADNLSKNNIMELTL